MFEQRLLQAPVLYFAVVNIIIRREEGEITYLEVGIITSEEEAGLRNMLCDCMPVPQPCDVDHRGHEEVVEISRHISYHLC